MLGTTTVPMNTCDLDDLDATPAWTEGLHAVETFVAEVSAEQCDTVVPWTGSRAGWSVGELEVGVVWVYGSPVIEMRSASAMDDAARTRVPLAETVVETTSASGRPVLTQDPVSKEGLWEELRALRAA